ncbi:MAG: triose-phosphate isomerase [Betaproteobacteria bacterium]|nr:triose-phosphate isomerase [Betaproteobacteria bacterium]
MRNRFVIGNWKLNGSLTFNVGLLNSLAAAVKPTAGKFCGVCVPTPYLAQVEVLLGGSAVGWGSQDVSRFDAGAYTGDVSASMVAEFGSRYAIVGHSERRAIFGDTDAMVAEKFGRAKKAGLTPILCVGESLAEREANQTDRVVSQQLKSVVDVHGIESLNGAILAYEPVWAIGTGKTASPAQAEEVHAFLRSLVKGWDAGVADALPILYGGSVKKSNAAELFAMPDVDGGLIGGAALIADDFLGIWNAL